MKNKLVPFFLLCLLAGSTVLFSSLTTGGSDWVKFTDKKAKFEIMLPEKPQADKNKTDKNKNIVIYRAALAQPLTNFYVVVTFAPEAFTDATFKQKANDYMEGNAKTYNEKFVPGTEMQYNGGLCIEYNYSAMGAKSLKRIFYKGSTMYELTVNPIAGDIPKEEADKFFGSFKYLP